MAQRKSSPATSSGKSSTRPGGKPSQSAKNGPKGAPDRRKTGGRPPAKKGKSIVNQRQTPWGLISAAVAVVLFAAAVVVIVIATHKSGSGSSSASGGVSVGGQAVDKSDPYRQPELAAATKIKGIVYKVQGNHTHVSGTVKYDNSPPTGGNHAPIWADCTGKVYATQLANENAVHALEHGAVWVTYNPATVTKAQLATLTKEVSGANKDRWLITPYKGLKTPVSLQAWGYQLFVPSVTDSRIAQFVTTLSANQETWPEQGASCSDPYFSASKSKPGHPQDSA